MADSPLVLKRFPNGVTGSSFFQQNAGDLPENVRTETIHTQGGSTNVRIVGGDLPTLLYTVQLGACRWTRGILGFSLSITRITR